MKMDGNIRVRTAKSHVSFYNKMGKVLANENHELFFIAASVAYKRGKRKPIEKSNDKFWSKTIKPNEWCAYYSMVLKDADMDFSKIRDDTAVIRHVEEYANAGIEILANEWLEEFVLENDGELTVDRVGLPELPKMLFCSILEEVEGS